MATRTVCSSTSTSTSTSKLYTRVQVQVGLPSMHLRLTNCRRLKFLQSVMMKTYGC